MRVAVVLIVWIAVALATALVGRSKGRSTWIWGVVGLLLGIVGLIIAAVVPTRRPGGPAATAAQH